MIDVIGYHQKKPIYRISPWFLSVNEATLEFSKLFSSVSGLLCWHVIKDEKIFSCVASTHAYHVGGNKS